MKILALNTIGDTCSIAISNDSAILAETTFTHKMRLSERLIEEIKNTLEDAHTTFHDIGAFAVAIGPGSFTGIRIGLMTIKTFAVSLNRPVVGISTFQACLPSTHDGFVNCWVVIPARKGHVFLQEFGWSADKWSESSLPQVLSTQNASEIVQQSLEGTRVFVSSSSEETLAELELTGKSNASVAEPFTAGTLIKLAYSKLVDGIDANPMAISPLYVAEPVINLPAIKRP